MPSLTRRNFLKTAASTAALSASPAILPSRAAAMQSTIQSIETFRVAYPVTGYFKFLKGKAGKPPTRDTVVVRVTDADGNTGWGQSVPSPTWSYETIESVQTTIDKYLAPALLGLDAFDESAIHAVLDRNIAPSFSTGQPLAKAGIDLALFDLTGRILGQTGAQRWKRKSRDAITLSWTINTRSIDEIAERIEEARARGFKNFNVKVGTDPKFDVEMCREIRRLAPHAFVWIDANGAYDLDTALEVAPRFADLGMAAFEQPLPSNRLSWYKELRAQKALPILMDEPVLTKVDLEEFFHLGLLDGVAMKVSRCGGLTESRRILQFMEDNGLLFFASGLTDPDLAFAACISLFGAYDLRKPAALNAPQFLSGTILAEPLSIQGDQAKVPAAPGLGVTVDEKKLKTMLVRS